ncbi:uncharacterized protein MKK02DRAFT_39003 [Dioszegia hungarica]|uniref:Lsm14-like N-terminal domain-containing protein n=1 Tax=Dioszegia hungarica TaxID=4972 RepID=A0AA38H522_9TREE|nr:uncharacterized protein MKK02DRAFT_39003 [Dioszegia hungarica]KAI9634326.1 hypothetical protein MKK02DRAFT_39003 [Dioszegia hungarica]
MDYAQFKGKPFQVVSKLGVRYTGIFDHISQEDQTICLSQVFNHGTEDRPTARKLPGSTSTLGWVRFHTESIESLALVENYIAPGATEEPADPILASVSNTAPGAAASAPAPASKAQQPTPSAAPASYTLPPKPPVSSPPPQSSLDRVQQSIADLSVSGQNNRGAQPNYRPPRRISRAQAIEVPDAEFDFSKGTQALEAEREARKVGDAGPSRQPGAADEDEEDADSGDSDDESDDSDASTPHPIAVQRGNGNGNANGNGIPGSASGAGEKRPPPGKPAYNKNSFFDDLSRSEGGITIHSGKRAERSSSLGTEGTGVEEEERVWVGQGEGVMADAEGSAVEMAEEDMISPHQGGWDSRAKGRGRVDMVDEGMDMKGKIKG